MTHVEATLPVQRTYTLANGATRRVVDWLPVRLPALKDADLGKVLRTDAGTAMLEHDGYEVAYTGNHLSNASVEAWQERMLRRARIAGGGSRLSGTGRAPVRNVVDDGAAAVAEAVAAAERRYVVVEGWVACLHEPGGLPVAVKIPGSYGPGSRRGNRGGETVWFPWLSFPLVARDEARAVSGALREAMAGAMPRVRVSEVAPTGAPGVPVVSDVAAAARMAARMEAGWEARWADALIERVRDVAGHLGTDALRAYADLLGARSAGEEGETLLGCIRAAAEALSGDGRPAGGDPYPWTGLRVAAISLGFRLDMAPVPGGCPAP